ncbi:hypothetical protein KKB71_03090 [Patescibacteria group bacterium]|nr:hypothetical protein [Patescibacteria group bacterium]
MFPMNHYSQDLEIFFSLQNYNPVQRGADLPWWGKDYFSGKKSFRRVMIIGQDSLAKDAGSIIFAAQFFPPDIGAVQYQEFYQEYINKMGVKKYFSPNKLKRVENQFIEWRIDFNFLYITDASKVYKKGSRKNHDFDKEKSKELLEAEIEFCNPDLTILLGKSPLLLLDKTKNYASVVESGELILLNNKKCIVAPFFIGNGPAGNNRGKRTLGFERRLEIATNLILKK